MELHRSVFGEVAFFLSMLCQKAQSLASSIFWNIAISPLLKIFRNKVDVEDVEGNLRFKTAGQNTSHHQSTVDLSVPSHIFAHKVLKKLVQINNMIAGYRSAGSLFEALLEWNPSIPVTGHCDPETAQTLELVS